MADQTHGRTDRPLACLTAPTITPTKLLEVLEESGSGPLDWTGIAYEVSPGNQTTYRILALPIPNPHASKILGLLFDDDAMLIALWPNQRNSRCALFRRRGGYLSAQYVSEKLHLENWADAEQITKILGVILERPTG